MAFKMDAGRGNYAKTGKGIPMSFKQDNQTPPNAFRTEEVMNLRENIQSMKKSKLSGYVDTEKEKKYYTEVTPAEKSVAADVLNSKREKFKSGPSLINKDQKRLLNSPDALKTIQNAIGQYRDPEGLGTYAQTEYTDPKSGEKILRGPSSHMHNLRGTRVNTTTRAMGKLDQYLQSFYK